ncbi:transcriptional regulator, XRE family [Methanothermus fervidus DSM 2088]|uniref:Putative HTH-type transcriptional regulatory protein Mfer_0667 n=1 Tax=Methanothermus fervidus (strain ATCC 43054 / DSM 2088 / JCM 10308 / V24 S) TaxID=523846 RepID=E3GYT4_METFV|nr:transcriptional regulator [Methanothermus fervidus]ADP77466.1 transcriptional regulator, XRE family [Methanothermus fervidus DSM 2088]
MESRVKLIEDMYNFFIDQGFEVSRIYERSCFDFLARKELLLLLLKVLVNINSFNEIQANEMKKVASNLLASPFLVGIRSKDKPLEDGVIYTRYGIPASSVNTLKRIIAEGEYPEIFADRGGYYVNIDGRKLRRVREKLGLSLKDLADHINVSRESIYKYERGLGRMSLDVALALEKYLGCKITFSIDVFQVPENLKYENKNKIKFSRFSFIKTGRTPFDALANFGKKRNETLITGLEKNRSESRLLKLASSLKDISLVAGSLAAFIMKSENVKESLKGVPVIRQYEIEDIDTPAELLKLVRERKEYT